MPAPSNAFTFFDIGGTLASVRVSAGGDRIEELIPYPDIPATLTELRDAGVRLGILSDPGPIPAQDVDAALGSAGLLPFFEDALRLYGPKRSPRLFEQAAAAVRGLSGQGGEGQPTLLFVGEDAAERVQARSTGFLVAPHPRLALPVLRQGRLQYLRLGIPPAVADTDWRASLRPLPLVPLHLSALPMGGEPFLALYAVADTSTASMLDDMGFWVDRLGAEDEPSFTDLYVLRDDRQTESGFLAPEGNSRAFFGAPQAARRVLASTHEGLLVSVPGGRSVESYHFAGARHGHNLKLVPATSLLDPIDPADNQRLARVVAASPSPLTAPTGAAPADTVREATGLTEEERLAFETHVAPAPLTEEVERYSGIRPVSGDILIPSRHIHHPGNTDAVNALVEDLGNIGAGRLTVATHRFVHEGRTLHNVEARLPAKDLDGIVLVTAHMDSTAARHIGYRASVDPAPGADDDGSGVASVLCAARAMLSLTAAADDGKDDSGPPRREIRFVLFNAEEHGLIGSRAYARDQALLGARIVAVFQLDMIGYDVVPARTFELHAGFTPSPEVAARSTRLAELIATMVPEVSPQLPAPQIYSGFNDPAERRSDHYSFQVEGYAACLATEDFFVGPAPTGPEPEPNPNYHMPTDDAVNACYAADIARAMAAAAWVAATR
jgi:bacterial leucyl aminopeptidase